MEEDGEAGVAGGSGGGGSKGPLLFQTFLICIYPTSSSTSHHPQTKLCVGRTETEILKRNITEESYCIEYFVRPSIDRRRFGHGSVTE